MRLDGDRPLASIRQLAAGGCGGRVPRVPLCPPATSYQQVRGSRSRLWYVVRLRAALGGEVVRIAAGSPHHINALDMVEGYGEGESPVIDKSEFVMSLFAQPEPEAGCGLLRYGNALASFVNRFPRDTELYRLMTTKPGE